MTTESERGPVTILELYRFRTGDDRESIDAGSVERAGLPFMSGCEVCFASLACYNAHPSRSGFIRCRDCIADDGWVDVAEASRDIFDGESEVTT